MNRCICDTCTGCGVCFCVCPQHCITMTENSISERIPVIKNDDCINCGLCKKICPQNNPLTLNYPQKCYVAWSKDSHDLRHAASGGVASVIARHQLLTANKYYGCDYDSNLDLCHFAVKDSSDIIKIQGSKYSQSNSYSVFPEIKDELRNNKVVFVGTPCQVAGLKRYLRNEYNNLITVDLVCHGTPPNTYFKEYMKELKLNNSITRITFRGEHDQKLTLWNKDRIIYQQSSAEDLYFSAFYKNMISRDSCYSCRYACSKRVSDLTIADFWGLGELKKVEKKSDRPSLILLNTNKGIEFFNSISNNLYYEERAVEEGIQGNGRLNCPPGKGFEARSFQILYRFFPFSKAVSISSHIKKAYTVTIKRFLK